MKSDLILELARQAGFNVKQWQVMTRDVGPYDITEPTLALERFATLVAEAEREDCAQLLDAIAQDSANIIRNKDDDVPVEPDAWVMEWTGGSSCFTTDKSDYVCWFGGKPHYPDNLHPLYKVPPSAERLVRESAEARVAFKVAHKAAEGWQQECEENRLKVNALTEENVKLSKALEDAEYKLSLTTKMMELLEEQLGRPK